MRLGPAYRRAPEFGAVPRVRGATGRRANRMLASGVAVAQFTSNTSRRVVGQWGGAGGACCEDHLAFCGEFWVCVTRLVLRVGGKVWYGTFMRCDVVPKK